MSLELDKNYLKNQQYKSTNYLDARIAIHKFNINKQSFFEWSWDKMPTNGDVKILEVGCGPGTFWLDNKKKLSDSSSVLMTDFSEAMIDKARSNIGDDSRFTYEIADIDNLEYENEEFDLVMAHFVLYHGLNKDTALSELRRVCNQSGRVSITTNSEQHMLNVYEIGKNIDESFPTDRNIDTFTEEIADENAT
jgi:ubiquinone/menaquinone biosynthesis C-methylase UbiE